MRCRTPRPAPHAPPEAGSERVAPQAGGHSDLHSSQSVHITARRVGSATDSENALSMGIHGLEVRPQAAVPPITFSRPGPSCHRRLLLSVLRLRAGRRPHCHGGVVGRSRGHPPTWLPPLLDRNQHACGTLEPQALMSSPTYGKRRPGRHEAIRSCVDAPRHDPRAIRSRDSQGLGGPRRCLSHRRHRQHARLRSRHRPGGKGGPESPVLS